MSSVGLRDGDLQNWHFLRRQLVGIGAAASVPLIQFASFGFGESSSSQNGLCTAAAIALFVSSDLVKTPPDFTSLEDEDETIAYAGHAPWRIEDEMKTRREAWNSDSGSLRRCSHGSSASHANQKESGMFEGITSLLDDSDSGSSGNTTTYNVLNFRATGDGSTDDTQIDGTLIAPSDPSEWKCKDDKCSKWITFHNLNHLSISGSGTINGQGTQWWACKDCGTKPRGFTLSDSNNVYISDLTFMDSPQKHIALERSTWVHATNLTITAPENSPNTDGIHVQQSRNVFIEQTLIGTGDDCISIGDGSAYLNISGITCGPGHGISVGSLGFNGANNTVEHVYVSDVVFRGTSNGARIKTWQGGKGYATDITFQRITTFDSRYPIIIDQFYCEPNQTCLTQVSISLRSVFFDLDIPSSTSAVEVSNVKYIDIHGTSSGETAVKFACSKTVPCTDISMNDIDLTSDGTSNTISSCQNVQGKQHDVFPSVPCLTSN
ncbi:probable polygalacturonase At1g80170 [Rhododendron vialii]|uniref:probable polygalacturonase At1g80170 n=1 Tax=Rhododendron vialii TaxID=182163 RepID=UPI00265DDB8E|nr:probable polygalacturonase At1g80170 [Rhododendron vialii]